MAHYVTLARENQFEFTCPVFNANTKMVACVALREAVWMGKTVEKRQGCQAAMNCSMCPAAAIVTRISYGKGQVSDDYGSLEQKAGKLHADVLQRIKNVLPIPRVLERFALSENERTLLASARERIEAQLRTAPGRDGKETSYVAPRKNETTHVATRSVSKRGRDENDNIDPTAGQTKTTRNQKLSQAAMTGDMTAAINAAA